MSYGSYYTDMNSDDNLYGYSNSTFNADTGYEYTHAHYENYYDTYDRTSDETRGPHFDIRLQSINEYDHGVYKSDTLYTITPQNGIYSAYGSHCTSTYNIYEHVATTSKTRFSDGYSQTTFHSYNYQSGANVYSYDTRLFYAYGFSYHESSMYTLNGESSYKYSYGYHYN